MSVITQFFPSGGGGGGGGNETPTGIKIPADGIPVEILGVSGSGGGGGDPYGAPGGSGAVFHATNYAVQPGSIVPITIGAAGAAGGCTNGQGSQGGSTCFNYPVLPLSVVGGGGGGAIGTPNGTGTVYGGCPGGNGGGGAGSNFQSAYSITSLGGDGCYYQSCNYKEVSIHKCSELVLGSPHLAGDYSFYSVGAEVLKECTACHMQYPWGIKAGYPGSRGARNHSPQNTVRYCYGCGGGSGGNGYSFYCIVSGMCISCPIHEFCGVYNVTPTTYKTDITGSLTEMNDEPTLSFGWPADAGNTGGAGGLIVKWSTAFGASPSTTGTDISTGTPGYYTYCFTSSGSIELP